MSSSESDLNKSDVTSDSGATSTVTEPDSSETSAAPPTHENQKPFARRSTRKRTQPKRLDPSETPKLIITPSPSKRSRKGSKRANSFAETDISFLEFFDVNNQWALFAKAHNMVFDLVNDAGNPYRKKLNELAKFSLDNYTGQVSLGVDDVVTEAWHNVRYCWANPLHDAKLFEDGSCAYTSMLKEIDVNQVQCAYAYIAISSAFKENDYAKGQGRCAAMEKEDNKTLLFFFRKIKHEFLHVVHRYLAIKNQQTFGNVGAPSKYTPYNQNGRKAEPEVGDHDEEEDSAGPILPLYNQEKLSSENPLCLFFNKKYLPLSNEHVEGLLNLDSSMTVWEGVHDGFFLFRRDIRAFNQNILDAAFYMGPGVTKRTVSRPGTSSTVCSRSSTSSPIKDAMVDAYTSDSSEYQAAWRRYAHVVIEIPSSMFPWLHTTGGNNEHPSEDDVDS